MRVLGIQFLKHLERCRVLLHLIDICPVDESDPVENAKIIVGELEKYSEKLAQKPRWLVFNKVDILGTEESAKRAAEIAKGMGWEDKYYMISAVNHEGVKALCWDIMEFMNTQPRNMSVEDETKQPEKVEFMWDDYHKEQLSEAEELDDDWDDDWDEDDDEGVEFIYQK
ncbi:GTP-binding protein Obg [Providencia rustigianii]|nr:GTP-binding protein Obg [Providencia rustigianii]